MDSCPVCEYKPVQISPGSSTIDRGQEYSIHCPRCRDYRITDSGLRALDQQRTPPLPRHLVSGFLREHTDRAEEEIKKYGAGPGPFVLTNDIIEEILKSPEIRLEIPDQARKIIANIARRSEYPGAWVTYNQQDDYSIAYARNLDEFSFFIDYLEQLGQIIRHRDAGSSFRLKLSPQGWEAYQEEQTRRRETRQCFVAMAMAAEYQEKLKPAREAIEKAITTAGYKPIFIDAVQHLDHIDDRIIADIRRSKFLVADFTGQRGGIYFEAGFAMGLGLPVIWMCQADDINNLHFDTRQYNHIVWMAPKDLYTKLLNRIQAVIV